MKLKCFLTGHRPQGGVLYGPWDLQARICERCGEVCDVKPRRTKP